jgi:Flp pilus assembly protein TadG
MSRFKHRTAHITSLARRFVTGNRGTTAIASAVGGAVFVGFAALAVDVGVAEYQRQSIQRAMDSALLSVVSTVKYDPKNLGPMQSAIQAYMAKSLPPELAPNVSVSVNPKKIGQELALEVSTTMPSSWLSAQILGGSSGSGSMSVTSLAFDKSRPVELALVLDTTASMTGTKITALKKAATDLVNAVMADDQETKIAVVPFGNYVNVGTSFRSASWLYIPPEDTSTQTVCSMTRDIIGSSNCRWVGYSPICTDGVCVPRPGGYNVCNWVYSAPYQVCRPQKRNWIWQGCVGSRAYPLNIRDTMPAGSALGNRHPGVLSVDDASTCRQNPITVLTSNKQTVLNAINALTLSGETYIPAGLFWGWNVLSSQEPFSEGAADDTGSIPKIMVLMSDGWNTRSLSSATYLPSNELFVHNSTNRAQADQYTSELCENIKKDGVAVFTVALEVSDSAMIRRLRDCASRPELAFTAQSASQLTDVFGEIAMSLRELALGQ